MQVEKDIDQQIKRKSELVKGRANWFFWLILLTLADALLSKLNSRIGFQGVLGVFDQLNRLRFQFSLFPSVLVAVLMCSLIFYFLLCGYFARKLKGWAFAIGGALYFADTFIFLYQQNFIAVALHLFILFCFYDGFANIREIAQLESQKQLNQYLDKTD